MAEFWKELCQVWVFNFPPLGNKIRHPISVARNFLLTKSLRWYYPDLVHRVGDLSRPLSEVYIELSVYAIANLLFLVHHCNDKLSNAIFMIFWRPLSPWFRPDTSEAELSPSGN